MNGKLGMFCHSVKQRLSEPTEVMLKDFRSQLEVSTGHRLGNLSINNNSNNYKWTKTHD